MSAASSVDLPADIVTIITSTSDSYTSWDASVSPGNTSNNFSLDLFLAATQSGIAAYLEYAYISGAASKSVDLIP